MILLHRHASGTQMIRRPHVGAGHTGAADNKKQQQSNDGRASGIAAEIERDCEEVMAGSTDNTNEAAPLRCRRARLDGGAACLLRGCSVELNISRFRLLHASLSCKYGSVALYDANFPRMAPVPTGIAWPKNGLT